MPVGPSAAVRPGSGEERWVWVGLPAGPPLPSGTSVRARRRIIEAEIRGWQGGWLERLGAGEARSGADAGKRGAGRNSLLRAERGTKCTGIRNMARWRYTRIKNLVDTTENSRVSSFV